MDSWRNFDLTQKKRRIKHAFDRKPIKSADDFAVVANTPCYFGFGNNDRPKEYWEDPKIMVEFQEKAYELHLSNIDDDTVPYFMPWFGTGVLASAFGSTVQPATGRGDDPAVIGTAVNSVADIAKLKSVNPYKDGLMPKVLEFIDYAEKNSDLPIGLTDMNSPFSTATQLCGYENFFAWMYEEPQAVKDLMQIISDSLITWVKVQKQHAGEPINASSGLQGVWAPKGLGIWLSDDDIVTVGQELYKEFIAPYYSKIFKEFGGGSLHFCGNGLHQTKNILEIENIRVVNNSPMGDPVTFGKMVNEIGHGRLTIQIQEIAPIDVEEYYTTLFDSIDDLTGIMIATFVLDYIASGEAGGAVRTDRDPTKAANEIVRVVRRCVEKKIKG